MAALAVVLLHAADEPEFAAAALRAAHAAAQRPGEPRPVLWLDAEGARVGARGVAEALGGGGGRPDTKALLEAFHAAGGRILVAEEAWRERGFDDAALVPGARLAPPKTLAELADAGYAFLSF